MTAADRHSLSSAYAKITAAPQAAPATVLKEEAPPTEITGGSGKLAASGPGIFKDPPSTSGITKDKPVGDYYFKNFKKESRGDVGMKIAQKVIEFLEQQPNRTFPGNRKEMQEEIAKILVVAGMNGTNAKFTARVLQRVLLDHDIIKDEMGMSKTSGHRAIRIVKPLTVEDLDKILG